MARCALVTGGSGGIGKAVVLQLLSEGYRVVTTGRNLAKLQAVYSTADPNLGFVEVDLETATGPADCIAKAMAILPRLDVLVNNAGGGYIGQQIEKAAPELFDSCFALNVRSPFFLIQAAIPHLVAASISTADANAASDAPSSSSASTPGSGAVVINLSSVAAQRPFSGMGPYCMSKAAVDMLTQIAAIELAPRNVRVCGVAPGTVSTEFHNSAGMGPEMAAAYYKSSAGTHPIGRVATPEDIAQMVWFLCDPTKAGFITGATMVVDGGRLLTASTAPQLSSQPPPAAASKPT